MDPLSPTVAPLQSTIIIYVKGICGIFCYMSMLISIDIIFYGPQIRIPYIMIVEAPL
jgi:hypothetical protein